MKLGLPCLCEPRHPCYSHFTSLSNHANQLFYSNVILCRTESLATRLFFPPFPSFLHRQGPFPVRNYWELDKNSTHFIWPSEWIRTKEKMQKADEKRSAYSLETVILLVPHQNVFVSVKQYQSHWTSYPGVLALDGRLYFFKEFPVRRRQKNRK